MKIFGIWLGSLKREKKKARKKLVRIFIDSFVDQKTTLNLLNIEELKLPEFLNQINYKIRLAVEENGVTYYQLSDIIKLSNLDIKNLSNMLIDGIESKQILIYEF